jgi:cupin 2 domain-containing protein
MTNILADLPDARAAEIFTPLLDHPAARIERIVSMGQTTPEDAPYDQPHDEWVLLLAGAARLRIEGQDERPLAPGDTILIPAHTRHRVTWTSTEPPAVWLAVHLPAGSPEGSTTQGDCRKARSSPLELPQTID